jgi:hypothetical protein
LVLAEVGFASWNWLARPAQGWVIEALDRGLLRQQAEIQRLAKVHRTLPLVCQAARLPPRVAAFCVKN